MAPPSHDETEDFSEVASAAQPLVGKGWQIPIPHVHDSLKAHQSANADMRANLAEALNIEVCNSLTCDIDLAPAKRGRFHGTVHIKAGITQTCVVTVEPFDSALDETVRVEFWPEKQIAAWDADRGEEAEIDENTPDPEPIEDDTLNVGRVIYESLVVAVDPYPRAPDAALETASTETEAERAAERPFAALEKLRSPGNE